MATISIKNWRNCNRGLRGRPPGGGNSCGSRRQRSWGKPRSLLHRQPWTPGSHPPRIRRCLSHGSSGIHHTSRFEQFDCLNFDDTFLFLSPPASSSFFLSTTLIWILVVLKNGWIVMEIMESRKRWKIKVKKPKGLMWSERALT